MKSLNCLGGLLKDFGDYVWQNKACWIIPIVVIFLLLFALVLTDSSSPPILYISPPAN